MDQILRILRAAPAALVTLLASHAALADPLVASTHPDVPVVVADAVGGFLLVPLVLVAVAMPLLIRLAARRATLAGPVAGSRDVPAASPPSARDPVGATVRPAHTTG